MISKLLALTIGMPKLYLWGALVGTFVLYSAVLTYKVNDAANKRNELRNVKAIIEQIAQRQGINKNVLSTDLYDLCVELGGLPDDCK